jgi:hypothetical protein
MKVVLKDVRISFCQSLFEAEQYQGKGAFRHSATYLIEPGSANDKAIKAAIMAVAEEKWPKKAKQMIEGMKGNTNKFCYQNGDLKDYDGYQGMWYIAGHRKQSDGQPLILDVNKAPLTAKDGKPYGGCYVNASIDIYAQDGENCGIRCGLLGVQFLRDGDSFGGASKSKGDEFDDLGEGSDADFDGGGSVEDSFV